MPNKSATFEVVNESTGEVIKMSALAKSRPRSPFNAFAMFSLETIGFLRERLSDKTLKPNDIVILFCMLENTLDENEVDVCIPDIARETGIHIENVRKCVKRLLFVNAIIKDKTIGKTQTYKISATLAWRGPADQHMKEIKRQSEIRRNERAKLTSVD